MAAAPFSSAMATRALISAELDVVPSIGGCRRRMNRLHHDRHDLNACGEVVKVLLQRHADRVGERPAVLAEHAGQGARGKILRQKPARCRANKRVRIGNTIGRLQGRRIGQANTRDQPQIDVNALETLAGCGRAGDQIGGLAGMWPVPEPVGRLRRRVLGAWPRGHKFATGSRSSQRQFVEHPSFDAPADPERPGR